MRTHSFQTLCAEKAMTTRRSKPPSILITWRSDANVRLEIMRTH